MRKVLLFLIFVLMSVQCVLAQGIGSWDDYADNMAEMYRATAEALNSQIKSSDKTPGAKNISISRNKKNQKDPIIFEGSGQDLIVVDDLSLNDYPFLYIEHPSKYGSFHIYDSDSDPDLYNIYYSHSDTYSVIPLFSKYRLKNISIIEATNISGKWKVALLPSRNDLVPEYTAPITINGDQSSVFYFKNPGVVADIKFESQGNNNVRQIFPDGTNTLLVNQVGAYSGKIKLKNNESYISIESDGRWIITVHGKSGGTPEVVFLDNSKNFESLTAPILQLNAPPLEFAEEEIEVQKGVLGKWYDCGDNYRFMIYYQPIMAKSQSYQIAKDMFIFFRVKIANLTDETVNGLNPLSFTLSRTYNGKDVNFPLSDSNSYATSISWDINTLRDKIAPYSELDTYLVFDVNGSATDIWTLSFSPMISDTNNKHCTIKMTLPKISY